MTASTTAFEDKAKRVPVYYEYDLKDEGEGKVVLRYWTDPIDTFETGNKVYASLVSYSVYNGKGDLSKSQTTGGLNHNNVLASAQGTGFFDKTTGNGTITMYVTTAGTYRVYTTAKN